MATKITNVEDVGTWRGNIEKIFIEIMVNEINKGNIDSGKFKTTTWRRMLLRSIVKEKEISIWNNLSKSLIDYMQCTMSSLIY